MKLPDINSCCFLFSIETGSDIIGCISILNGIIQIIAFSILCTFQIDRIFYPSFKEYIQCLNVIYLILAIYGMCQVIAAISLLIGFHKGKYICIQLWIISQYIYMFLIFVLYFTHVCYMFYTSSWEEATFFLVIMLLTQVITLYCILVVSSLKKNFKKDPNECIHL